MTSRSAALGTSHDVALGTATLRYCEAGPADGSPVVFVHGLLVNADLWRKVVPPLAQAGLRCIAVDWPLGSHELPVPDADLSPPGVAALIAEFLAARELHDVTIVANDTGGAITQILITQHPERIARVVLTPSDCFDKFFPPLFASLPKLARVPGATWLLAKSLRLGAVRRLPIAFGWVAKHGIDREAAESYTGPIRRNREIRKDVNRFLRGVHKRHTLAAAEALPGFDRPVLLAWASEDRVFPYELGERLAKTLPNAALVPIADSYTFVPEDQPEELARLVLDFVREHAAA
ncbi:MAG TPA: alpha/beta hydrolase [Jatrophihabitantaceae bacterium]|nr:alpha/beta hydrolase [Jatrophihabitantaceae bacterium]